MKWSKYITIGCLFGLLSVAGCSKYQMGELNISEQQGQASTLNQQEQSDKSDKTDRIDNIDKTDQDNKSEILKLLQDNGVDTSIIESESNTELGGTLLGNAKQVKQFRTLNESEEYNQCYFGFHNSFDSLSGYSLVGVYSIGNEYMQGIYELGDTGETITVKFDKDGISSELRAPYELRDSIERVSYDKYNITYEGDTKDRINLICLDAPTGKAYTIYSLSGLESENAQLLAKELIDNLELIG